MSGILEKRSREPIRCRSPIMFSGERCRKSSVFPLILKIANGMRMETALSGTDDFCDAGAGFMSSSPVVDYGEQTAPEIAAAGKEGEISGPVSGTMEFFVVICTASRDPSASWLKFESQSGPDHVNYCQDAGAEISFRVEEQP